MYDRRKFVKNVVDDEKGRRFVGYLRNRALTKIEKSDGLVEVPSAPKSYTNTAHAMKRR